MHQKPTYKELEQKVIELEKEVKKGKQAEKELQDIKQKWMSLVENTNDFIMIIDDKGKIQYINRAIPPHSVNQVVGKTLYDFAAPEHHEMIKQAVTRVFERRVQGSYTSNVKHPTGIQWFETTMIPIIEEEKVRSAMSFNKIITERLKGETALKKRTQELELKTKTLEDVNRAMNVLLQKREKDKTDIEDNVLTNVKELIEPYFKKIKKTMLNERQKTFLNIIESNMDEIISPCTRGVSLKYLTLTPKEIQIANLIKHGYSSKIIAQIMNISPRTVDTHRKNIRKKIGLEKRNENLRSYLLSFQ